MTTIHMSPLTIGWKLLLVFPRLLKTVPFSWEIGLPTLTLYLILCMLQESVSGHCLYLHMASEMLCCDILDNVTLNDKDIKG